MALWTSERSGRSENQRTRDRRPGLSDCRVVNGWRRSVGRSGGRPAVRRQTRVLTGHLPCPFEGLVQSRHLEISNNAGRGYEGIRLFMWSAVVNVCKTFWPVGLAGRVSLGGWAELRSLSHSANVQPLGRPHPEWLPGRQNGRDWLLATSKSANWPPAGTPRYWAKSRGHLDVVIPGATKRWR